MDELPLIRRNGWAGAGLLATLICAGWGLTAGLVAAGELLLGWITGITNALVASLLLTCALRRAPLITAGQARSIPIQQLIFNLLMAVVVLPACTTLFTYGPSDGN